MMMEIDKKKVLSILSVVLIIVIYTYVGFKTFSVEHNTYYLKIGNSLWVEPDEICLDLVYSGELYQGQSTCAQGPVTYLTAALIKLVFQDKFSSTGILITESFIAFVLALISLAATGYSLIVLPLLLFIILHLTYVQFASTLSCFFFVVALYLMYKHSENKSILFFAGVFVSLAFFSKATMWVLTSALIPTIVFHYVLQKEIMWRKEIGKVGIFLAGLMITSLVILFLYPNSIQYNFIVQIFYVNVNPTVPLNLIQQLHNSFMTGTGIYHAIFVFLMTLLFGFFSSQYHKQFLPLTIVMLAIIPVQISLNTLGFTGQTLYFPIIDYHFFPYLFIFVSAFILLYHKSRTWITLLLLLTVFWWAGYFTILSQLDYFFIDLDHLMSPTPESVFHEFLNTLNYSQSFVDMNIARHITQPIYKINRVPHLNGDFGKGDAEFGPGVKLSGLFNETKNQVLVNYDKEKANKIASTIYTDLTKNKFDKIVVGPYPDSSILVTIYYLINNNISHRTNNFCTVPIPLLFGSNLIAPHFLLFSNSDCETMKEKMMDFFLPRLSSICRQYGKSTTQTTLEILAKTIEINQPIECNHVTPHTSRINPLGFLTLFLSIAFISFKKFKDVLRTERPQRCLEYFFLALGTVSTRAIIQLVIILLLN